MPEPDLPPLYFIRHGETEWNREKRIQGQVDTPLSTFGVGQAQAIGRKLKFVEPDLSGFQLHCSPMTRTRQTMAEVLAAFGLPDSDVHYDDRLREQSFGVFEGKTWPELHAAGIQPELDPESFYDWRPEGGENKHDLSARVSSWLRELTVPTVVVAHGAVSRVVRGLVFDLPKREIPALSVSQNKFYRIRDGGLDWFDARKPDS